MPKPRKLANPTKTAAAAMRAEQRIVRIIVSRDIPDQRQAAIADKAVCPEKVVDWT
jgi:hypothetical protein